MSQRYLGGIITASPTAPTLSSASGVWTVEQQFQNYSTWQPQRVARSVRLRSGAPAYFTRTPGTAGNRRVWTWSGWVKRGSFSGVQVFFGALQTGTTGIGIGFQSTGTFFYSINGVGNFETSALYRDPSAWYHIVFAFDSTQATQANRAILYVNGVNVAFATNGVVLNNNYDVNNTVAQSLGQNGSAAQYFDGYLAEVNLVDGKQLTASSFGAFDSDGIWQPLPYTGTYGTNGYYLTFADNSGITAATIGKDYSGNGNNYTPSGISITSGTTYDSMTDVPTLTSATASNYPVWNSLKRYTNNMTFSNANLTVSDAGTSSTGACATMRTPTSGKWYWEVTATTISGSLGSVLTTTEANADAANIAGNLGYYRSSGTIANLAGTLQTSGATYTSGDVIGVAVDIDNGTVQFYKNNVAQGATPSFTFTAGTVIVPAVSTDNAAGTKTFAGNFGQQPFAYTPPTGFIALNTQNLPLPTIQNGAKYMAATTYTGTGATQIVSNAVNSVSFKPDFVWIKIRSGAANHDLIDSVRGYDKYLVSNSTVAEATSTDQFSSFNSNGFTLGANAGAGGNTNQNGSTYVAWQWQAGQGSTSSNTNGSITSTVSVNATAGFSVVSYTATGSNATVGHGLGVAPSMIIIKNKASGTTNWPVYHVSTTAAGSTFLNAVNAYAAASTMFNSTAPTSTVFSVGTNTNLVSGATIAYCFAPVTGYSAFGSYAGTSSADGPFIYLGFRPRWIMIKNSTLGTAGQADWMIIDTTRSTSNVIANYLLANLSNAEATSGGNEYVDILSNGFKLRGTSNYTNGSTHTYIYAAFAENPFKTSRAR